MKITNSDVIKSGERELIDSIIGDLDWDAIEEIVKNRHKLKIQDDVEYRQGDIIVHKNQVAYKLDFDVKMTLSVVFDRDGNYLSLVTSDADEDVEASETPPIAADESNGVDDLATAAESSTIRDESNASETVEGVGESSSVPDESDGIESKSGAEADSSESFASDDIPTANPENEPGENFSKMASHIAEMISEINDD